MCLAIHNYIGINAYSCSYMQLSKSFVGILLYNFCLLMLVILMYTSKLGLQLMIVSIID